MRKIVCVSFVVLALIGASLTGTAQTKPTAEQQKMAEEAYMKAAAVTENHALLKHFLGKWNVAGTMWQMPGTPPEKSLNTSEVTAIMGGRFIVEKFKGTMMNMPFEGMRITGYDNMQKKYVTFWIDNSSTAFFVFSGTYDAAKKTFTDMAKWANPMGGMTNVRMVTRIISPDEHIQEMYMTMPDGKEFKSMEDHYTRIKQVAGAN